MDNIFKLPELTIDINPPGENEDMLSVVGAIDLYKKSDDLPHRPEETAESSLSDPQEYVGPDGIVHKTERAS